MTDKTINSALAAFPITQRWATKPYPHSKPVFVERFKLIVRDLALVSAYYQNVIGLEKIAGGNHEHILGVGDKALVTLEHDSQAHPSPSNAAGLFHSAFLLPLRQDLAHYLQHSRYNNIPIVGASDHMVSEALYLQDPEGNGIEIYADRPPEQWTFDAEGVVMNTARLDMPDLLSQAPQEPWRKLPVGTVVGHIHLQVGDLAQAESFYRDAMGLAIMESYSGVRFFASGNYHHHIAANVWSSLGAARRQPNMTGLKGYMLQFNDHAALKHVLDVAEQQELTVVDKPDGKVISDPWNIEITLTT